MLAATLYWPPKEVGKLVLRPRTVDPVFRVSATAYEEGAFGVLASKQKVKVSEEMT